MNAATCLLAAAAVLMLPMAPAHAASAQLSSQQLTSLKATVARMVGEGGIPVVSDVVSTRLRAYGNTIMACGMIKTTRGKQPFYAHYDSQKDQWLTGGKKGYGTLEVCAKAGLILPEWKDMMETKNTNGGSGGNYRVTAEEFALITRDVGSKTGGTSITGLRASRSKRNVKVVCGYVKSASNQLPFYGVLMVKSSKGPARFEIVKVGNSDLDKWTTHGLCKAEGIKLAGG